MSSTVMVWVAELPLPASSRVVRFELLCSCSALPSTVSEDTVMSAPLQLSVWRRPARNRQTFNGVVRRHECELRCGCILNCDGLSALLALPQSSVQ